MNTLMLPQNLNIEQILVDYPPNFTYHPDEFRYLIGLVIELPSSNKGLFDSHEYPYTYLYSQLLKRVVWDYQYHLQYLVKVGVLETDGYYSNTINRKSKGYRLTAEYRTPVQITEISASKLVKRIERQTTNRNSPAIELYPDLVKWFDEIEADEEKAHQIRAQLYQENTTKGTRREIEVANLKDASYQYMIEPFVSRRYKFIVDDSGKRFHSNLTNLKSEFRSCLTYQGQPLVSIDLCNSQPFLASILFTPHFYSPVADDERLTINQLSEKSQVLLQPVIEEVMQYLVTHNTRDTVFPTLSLSFSTPGGGPLLPMCGKLEEKTGQIDEFLMYSYLVETGQYYEYMQSRIKRANGEADLTRNEVKETTLTTFFANPKDDRQYFKMHREAFCQVFPMVYGLFSLLKSKQYSTLAILLQNIEAILFLDHIANRISCERPELPIFTLHDSIVTTVGNEEYVETVMQEELQRLTGMKPSFKREYWK
ncbi:hypothetical protein LX87_05024 [Larkinella arboricola]|uniref:Uncharacterized protein n=1 Tax=Larkinella arboricola TaxID=643671 RepID=A0A327WPP8_LARAB|nr:hypothetical protein [Larkinella arboricola]RAJ92693.1 hypothetical protein LX87_05024 [Larkinella arboricola]